LGTELLKQDALNFINKVNELELDQMTSAKTIASLQKSLKSLAEINKKNRIALDIATHAIEILTMVSDEAVKEAYKFLEENLNASLERIFDKTTRKIKLKEYTRSNQYPQLEFQLHVGNGIVRSLKSDSGHGLAQIVSLLSILCLIVITGSRRIMVLDEVLSGLSVRSMKIVSDILWTFTEIGFQFIINEHGYRPKGADVYHLEMIGDVSRLKERYIEETGVYLNGDVVYEDDETFVPYSNSEQSENKTDDTSSTDETAEVETGSDIISI